MKMMLFNVLRWAPLAVFLWFMRSGAGGVDWRMAYLTAGGLGVVVLLMDIVTRRIEPLYLGTNLWLISGAVLYLVEFWTSLGWYARLGSGSLFAWVALTSLGVCLWIVLRGRNGRKDSAIFFGASVVALGIAVACGGSVFMGGTLSFMGLLVLQQLLARGRERALQRAS
ncbi:hypothetical protein [Desulfovibrio ferrophilus]|uniref:Uncharacterized protein n=1 Tax=Desulfovibrio ferrophilus TaxID=241368 RepID=A0A2Z6AZY5_9BACT|nr:hypothetical protein [Desulfovibrio ferrophilus]BBD08804.1 uncharacterized protein DFE_2078 [Desulfovibrio ferrophilus]